MKKRSSPTLRTLAKQSAAAQLNDTFFVYWRTLAPDFPSPAPEYVPIKERKWRCDFAFPAAKVAVELDGGGFGKIIHCTSCGAVVHARKQDGSVGAALRMPYPSHYNEDGHARDNEKSNALALAGWAVLRFTSRQLEEDPSSCIDQVKQLLLARL